MAGGKGTSVVALDKRTGKETWRALDSAQPGYAPPMLYQIDDEQHLVIWNSDVVAGLNPDNGEVYWSVPIKADSAMAIAAPRLEGRKLFLTYYRDKSAMIEIDRKRRSAKVAWFGRRKTGVGCVMSTPWLQEGLIFGCAINGELTCADLESGKQHWQTYAPFKSDRRTNWGNLFIVAHEDRFFLPTDMGELIIARMNREGYEELDRTKLIEPTTTIGSRKVVWSHPAFANKRIYLRNDREIRCYSLATGAAGKPSER